MKKLLIPIVAVLGMSIVGLQAADAKAIWEKDCAKCHGADGAGKTKMGEKLSVKDYTTAKVQDEMKDADMTKAVKDGVKDKDGKVKMKAFELTDEEIKGLVAHIRSFKK